MVDVLPPVGAYPKWEVNGTATEGYITISVMQNGSIFVKQEMKTGAKTLLKTLQAINNAVTIKEEPMDEDDPVSANPSSTQSTPATVTSGGRFVSETNKSKKVHCSIKIHLTATQPDSLTLTKPVALIRNTSTPAVRAVTAPSKKKKRPGKGPLCISSSKNKTLKKLAKTAPSCTASRAGTAGDNTPENYHEYKKRVIPEALRKKYKVDSKKDELLNEHDQYKHSQDDVKTSANFDELDDSVKADVNDNGDPTSCLEVRNVVSLANIKTETDVTAEYDNQTLNVASSCGEVGVGGEPEEKPSSSGLKVEYLKPQQCEICKKKFPNMYLFQVHLHNLHFQCQKCWRCFLSRYSWLEHKSQGTHTCGECAVQFCLEKDLRAHYIETHAQTSEENQQKDHQCLKCPEGFSRKTDLKMHEAAAHRNQCTECTSSFSEESMLKKHIEKKHMICMCEQCGKSLMGTANLRIHHKKSHGHGPCDVCGKQYKTAGSLAQHRITEHGVQGEYDCAVCGQQFINNARLASHMLSHTGEKSYMCKICGKTFGRLGGLRAHEWTHSEDRPHKCTLCDSSFKRSWKLKEHLSRHDGSRSVQCAVCFRVFKGKYDLKSHTDIHLNRRSFKCPVCPAAFNTRASLYSHKRRHKENGEME